MRTSPHGPFALGGGVYPSTLKLLVAQLPPNGTTDVAPALRTPGTASRRGITIFQNAVRAVSLPYLAAGNATPKVSTLRDSKPGLTSARREKLFSNKPPPV